MKRAAALALAAAVAWSAPGCGRKAVPAKPAPPPPVGALPGMSAPPFMLKDSKGATYSEASFVGRKAQLLVFGTTSCPVCQSRVADVEAVRAKRGDAVEVAAVLLSETAEKAEKFASDYKAGFRMVLDPQNISISLYKLGNYPYFVLIDRAGVIRESGREIPSDALLDEATR